MRVQKAESSVHTKRWIATETADRDRRDSRGREWTGDREQGSDSKCDMFAKFTFLK